jgi:hypothetical protein
MKIPSGGAPKQESRSRTQRRIHGFKSGGITFRASVEHELTLENWRLCSSEVVGQLAPVQVVSERSPSKADEISAILTLIFP